MKSLPHQNQKALLTDPQTAGDCYLTYIRYIQLMHNIC